MPYEYRYIDEALSGQLAGPLNFTILSDDASPSKVSFIQPCAEYSGDASSVGPTSKENALSKLTAFLALQSTRDSDLVVAPEYFAPWELMQSLNSGAIAPAPGKLWVFGFNGITPERLVQVERENANLKFEYDREYPATGTLLGPVCYIFRADAADGRAKTFCVIQLKTYPMAGELESQQLIRHRRFYIFRNATDHIRLSTLICADALNTAITNNLERVFPDWADKPYWLLHLQLNPEPRSDAFRSYRYRDFGLQRTLERKAIFCVNWARSSYRRNSTPNATQYGMSALYLKLGTKIENPVVDRNHRLGAYYAQSQSRLDTLIFNFMEACYCFDFGKITHQNLPGPQSVQKLPRMSSAYHWIGQQWQPQNSIDDHSNDRCPWRRPPSAPFLDQQLLESPLKRELLVVRSAGYLNGSWKDIKSLDSISLHENEAVRRVTYLQDNVGAAREFRDAVFPRFDRLIQIIREELAWPLLLPKAPILTFIDLEAFFNARVGDDTEVFLVYLGDASDEQVKEARLHFETSHGHSALRKCVHLWWDQNGTLNYECLSSQQIIDAEDENSDIITGVNP